MKLYENDSIKPNSSAARSTTYRPPVKSSAVSSNSSVTSDSSAGHGIKDWKPGKIFRGQITNITAKEMTIELDDGSKLSGKYESSIELSIGDRTSFRIMQLSDQGVVIKPISSHQISPQDLTIQKALDAAGLPMTEKNAALVDALLKNQMPINKQMISLLLQQSYLNKNVSFDTLAVMNKFHLPITQENAAWFENYTNYEHRMIQEMNTIIDHITALSEPNSSCSTASLATLHSALLSMTSRVYEDAVPENNSFDISSPLSSFYTSEELQGLSYLFPEDVLEQNTISNLLSGSLSLAETAALIEDYIWDIPLEYQSDLSEENSAFFASSDLEQTDSSSSSFLQLGQQTKDSILALVTKMRYENHELAAILPAKERTNLSIALETMLSQRELDTIEKGTIRMKDILPLLNQMLHSGNEHSVKKLLGGKAYQSILKEAFLTNWTLSPDKLMKKGATEELYAKIYRQTTGLLTLSEKIGTSSDLGNSLQGLKENIEFMNTLNELYSYIQLPVKLKDQSIHSELYVYTNKKNLKENPKEISVLLHLDMAQLGSLDIYVSLNQTQITSKFYSESEDSLHLMKTHIEELKKALEAKGFVIQTDFNLRQKKEKFQFINNFIEKEIPASSVKRYSFDVRA